MSFKLDFKNAMEVKTLSDAYTQTMDKLLSEDKDVVTIDADLMHAVNLNSIADKYKDRVLNVGIAEANMISIAAGMSGIGKKPYVQSFAAFAARRTFDQIFISCAYGHNSIRIFGSDPGIAAVFNGGTHMPFEDVGLMRTIPGATIIDIVDNTMMCDILKKIKDMDGVIYFRASRTNTKKIYDESSTFEIGRGNVLADGEDVTIITSGLMVSEALNAANTLKSRGVSAAVIDMFTIKPIDSELIIKYAKKTKAIVTTDNHNANGGLGDAVASVLAENCPTPMKKVAVFDEFGEVGSLEYLRDRFKLNEEGIIGAVNNVLKMK